MHYRLQCAKTATQIKSLTLAHCSLYTSQATSCTSSACRAIEQPSHCLVPARYTGGYSATYGYGQISEI